MQLRVPVFTIKPLNHPITTSRDRKWLITDHSDMMNMPILNRLYDDACDVGFATYNEVTGVTIRWHLIEENKDADGDVTVTIFGVCSESLRTSPQMEGWQLHVLND